MTRSPVGRLRAADPSRAGLLTREQALAAQQGLLWTPRDVSRWGAVVSLAGVVLLGSWYSVAGKATWHDQVLSMNVGIAALVAANGAGIMLLLSGRRAIGVRRVALLGDPAPVRVVPYPVEPDPGAVRGDELVGGEGLTHYHRGDCPMAAGKPFLAASRDVHERSGRAACGVCRP